MNYPPFTSSRSQTNNAHLFSVARLSQLILGVLTLAMFDSLIPAAQAAIENEEAYLKATRVIETGDRSIKRPGPFGERGVYQFRRSTWRDRTSTSFDLAYNRDVAHTVARRHLAWIVKALDNAGVPATPYNVALVWNAGFGNVVRGTTTAASHDYAERVVNLMESLIETKAAPTIATAAPARSQPLFAAAAAPGAPIISSTYE